CQGATPARQPELEFPGPGGAENDRDSHGSRAWGSICNRHTSIRNSLQLSEPPPSPHLLFFRWFLTAARAIHLWQWLIQCKQIHAHVVRIGVVLPTPELIQQKTVRLFQSLNLCLKFNNAAGGGIQRVVPRQRLSRFAQILLPLLEPFFDCRVKVHGVL